MHCGVPFIITVILTGLGTAQGGSGTAPAPISRAPVSVAPERSFLQRVRTWWHQTSPPYLPTTAPKPVRILVTSSERRPPLLPRIVPAATSTPVPAPPPPAAEIVPPAPPAAPATPPPVPSLEEEALRFFQRSNERPADQKNLGPFFDATFSPGAVPATSSATYRRE